MMHNTMRRLNLYTLMLLAMAPLVSHLQALDFSCMALEEGAVKEELFYRDGEKFLPIKLRSQRRSLSYSVAVKEGFVGFYVKGPISPEGIQTYTLVARGKVKTNSSRLLFLLAKREGRKLPFGVLPVDDSLSAFPAASFRFINVTPHILAIKFGEQKFKIKSGGIETIETNATSESFLPIHMIDQSLETIFKSSWYVNPRVRELVIIHPIVGNPTQKFGFKLVSGIAPKPSLNAKEL